MDTTGLLKRKDAVSLLVNKQQQASKNLDAFWTELSERINDGQLIPIINNSLRLEHIFHQLLESAQAADCGSAPCLTVENVISQAWASEIEYPLADNMDLARVAQYNRVKSLDAGQAKKGYLRFLKDALLTFAENLGADASLVTELRGRMGEASFSDLIQELEYPQFAQGQEDPLRLLARLPIHIYLTTSHHDFVERALLAEGKKPVTQICFWSGPVSNLAPEHETNPAFVPTESSPLVYHLFGLERYSTSLVLSEDDYLDFLVKVTQPQDPTRPLIPLPLQSAISVSSLILFGYHLQGWDFRTLFRGVICSQPIQGNRPLSLIIQLTPGEQYHIANDTQARDYLETYFSPSLFKVQWSQTDQFINLLWNQWNTWRAAR